jgi:MFS family permease
MRSNMAHGRDHAGLSSSQAVPSSAWSPLRQPAFRALWIAALVSNIGTWMQNVAGTWLMTSLTPSTTLVALVQSATSLPVFLVGLPAGALADVVDRRRLMLLTQAWMLVTAGALGVLTLLDVTSPWIVLAFTFALGLGAALYAPAWEAIQPEVVPRAEVPAAVALGGVSVNVARAVGPAVGGVLVAATGPGLVFLLNAVTFLVVIVVVARWRPAVQDRKLPPEHLLGAMRAGARYVRHAPELQAVLVRVGVFIVCSSAMWALLPVVARGELGVDALGYGVLLGCVGVGAVAGSTQLPRLRQRLSADLRVAGATVVFALVTLALAYVRNVVVLALVLLAGGVAWIILMASFNAAAQAAVPAWVRARGLAVYLVIFQGGMGLGSVVWGVVADQTSAPVALVAAALALIVGLGTTVRWRLQRGEALDLTSSAHWPEPIMLLEPAHGPVLVTVEYRVDPEQLREFAAAMQAVAQERRRDGALRWELFFDAADPGRCLETFLLESWVEHLRQHARVTMTDLASEARVRAFHIGNTPPVVSHFVADTLPVVPVAPPARPDGTGHTEL